MLYHHTLDKILDRGPKLWNFKIGRPILQKDENRELKLQLSQKIIIKK